MAKNAIELSTARTNGYRKRSCLRQSLLQALRSTSAISPPPVPDCCRRKYITAFYPDIGASRNLSQPACAATEAVFPRDILRLMIPIRMRRIGTIAVLGVVIALIGVGLIGIASQTGSQSVAAAGANSREGSVAGVSSWTVRGDAGQDHTSGGAPSGPAVGGRGVILLNSRDGRILFERDADKPLPMASTTKIMTAVLVLENLPMDRKVSVSDHAASVGESELWLEPGLSLIHISEPTRLRRISYAVF